MSYLIHAKFDLDVAKEMWAYIFKTALFSILAYLERRGKEGLMHLGQKSRKQFIYVNPKLLFHRKLLEHL